MDYFKLTNSEYEVMKVLWQENRPLAKAEIIKSSPKCRTWKDSYIHIIIQNLIEKGAVHSTEKKKWKNKLVDAFAPSISSDDYNIMQIINNEDITKKTIPSIMAALLDDNDDEDLLNDLSEIIRKKKEQLQ